MATQKTDRQSAPVISSMEDAPAQRSPFKDDGDMRLFAGDLDSSPSYDFDDGGMRMFSDD